MVNVLITLTPSRQNKYIDSQKPKLGVAVLPIMDMKTHSHSTLEMQDRAYQLQEFTRKLLQHLIYSDYRQLFATQDEWTIVKDGMEVFEAMPILDPVDVDSVSNGSGPSLRVQVRVQTEPLSNWRSGS